MSLDRSFGSMLASALTFEGRMAESATHEDELLSEKWDCSDGVPRRLHYAVFAPQRTGSELLCAYLRQQGLGVPIEYLNPVAAPVMAKRLKALNKESHVMASLYWRAIIGIRSKHGIFGTKVQPDQLMLFTQKKVESARKVVKEMDRLVLLRRRDKLAQAISLARAKVTDQWAIYGKREKKGVTLPDSEFFPIVAQSLAKVLEDDAYIDRMVASIDPARIRRLHYEDLDEGTLNATADWLWASAGGRSANLVPEQRFIMPTRMDQAEASALKDRFMRHIGTW